MRALFELLNCFFGNGLDSFKLTLLNRMALRIMKSKIPEQSLNFIRSNFWMMLRNDQPDLQKFKANNDSRQIIRKTMGSEKSILIGLNPIADLILQEKVVPETGIDFFSLYNIKVSQKTFWDIHILINKPITDVN